MEEALDRTVWRNHFGRGFGPVAWQITDDDDYILYIKMDEQHQSICKYELYKNVTMY